MGKYACAADVSRCFLQIKLPRSQQDWFGVIWFGGNDLDGGKIKIYCFTRHVWGVNSSPYVALLAFKRLVEENPTDASPVTLNAVKENRYMDDVLFASNNLLDAVNFAEKGTELFKSRGFNLHKWAFNSHAKSVLQHVPICDQTPSVRKIDIGSQPLPDSSALGLSWDPEADVLKIGGRKFAEASTRREMTSQLASHVIPCNPLGMVSPLLLGKKLILQKVAASGVDWDESLPVDIKKQWKKWIKISNSLEDYTIPRNCLMTTETDSQTVYQLHGFCDASDFAFSCVIFLRSFCAGKAEVSFVVGKSKLVLTHQKGWFISRKEVEAAKLLGDLILQTSKALSKLRCSVHCWTGSQVVLKWIVNPDLSLARFVRRRVDKIHLVVPPDCWNYVNTSLNPADVGTRESSVRRPGSLALWLEGPPFLLQERAIVQASGPVVVHKALCTADTVLDPEVGTLEKLIEVTPTLYDLKKRCAYLVAFTEFVVAKAKGNTFRKPLLTYIRCYLFG